MRIVSSEQLTELLSGLPTKNPRIVASGNFSHPWVLLEIADKALPEFRLFMLNAHPGIPTRPGVIFESPFIGSGMRNQPALEYLPARLSLVPKLLKTTRRPDIVMVQTTTPRNGRISLGLEVNILPAAIEAARSAGGLLIAQMNPNLPYTFGDGEYSVDEFDYAIEAETPLMTLPARTFGETMQTIGKSIAGLIPNGATIQAGIGGVPDATLAALTEHRGLRVWTEMVSDGVLALQRAGALDSTSRIIASFCGGSEDFYAWINENPMVQFSRTERTNSPGLIARQHAMTSINTAMQVDLHAQANAFRVGHKPYSGFGGQTDFIVGALHADQGKAIIALASWHPKANVSTIVPQLKTAATSFQHSHIITEHNVANLWGADHRDQARQLVQCAHPDARAELTAAAQEMGLF